jgi:glycosyltransferase involved in cell wall biosynthesis
MGEALMHFANVSVIIPCFCCSKTIGRAVDSILKQTLLPKEIILVDDFSNDHGSTLNKLLEIKDLNQSIIIKIIALNKNDGPGTARNAGWDQASQPYIAFLDADDSWHPKKIEIQYGWMKSSPKIALSFHRSWQIELNENLASDLDEYTAKPVTFRSLLFSNCVPTRSVMLKTSAPHRFCPGKRHAEDYLLWLKIAYTERSIWFVDLALSYSYKHDFGVDGLNSFLYKSHTGVLDAYKQILKDRLISHLTYCVLIIYESFKYVRRICLVYFRGAVN